MFRKIIFFREDTIGPGVDIVSGEDERDGGLGSGALSEAAKRSILGRLRVNGYPPHEKDIYTHPWLDLQDSDGSSQESMSNGKEYSSSHSATSDCIDNYLSGVDEDNIK